jgi:hypothetical protein
MCAPVLRDPAVLTALPATGSVTGRPADLRAGATPLDGAPVPEPARPADEAARVGLADRADQPDEADQARRVGELTPLG